MQIIGTIAYLITSLLAFWLDWKIGVAFITFYIGFKIEIYDNRESRND